MSASRMATRLWLATGTLVLAALGCNTPGQPAAITNIAPVLTAMTAATNQPPATPTVAPSATSAGIGASPPQPPGTQRINFAMGGTSASVPDKLNPAERLTYMINAGQNQTMTISLTSSGRLGLGVTGPSGVLQDSAEGKSSWNGVLPQTGDYLIFVQSMDGKPSTFTMQVNIPPVATSPFHISTLCSAPAPNPSIPGGASWATYCNMVYGFGFRHPLAQVTRLDQYDRILLPVMPGTNLGEKYLDFIVKEDITDCSPTTMSIHQGEVISNGTASFNGVSFNMEMRRNAGAGNAYEWVTYSTAHGSACVGMNFLLHSYNPDNLRHYSPSSIRRLSRRCSSRSWRRSRGWGHSVWRD